MHITVTGRHLDVGASLRRRVEEGLAAAVAKYFDRAIESVLHAGITAGCTATTYCPGDRVTRSQMSLFLGRGVAGGGACAFATRTNIQRLSVP